MAVLFFSACMPFMAFTNLLRGVDLPTVFFILFFLFLLVCAVNLLAIFFACLPLSRPFKILLALYGFFQSFWIIVPAIFASMTLMRSGVGAMMGQRNFWITTVTVIGVAAALAGLLYVLSVALISPLSANRASPVRRYITVIWALGGILCFTWVLQARAPEIIFVWTYVTFVLMQFSLLVIVSNSDEISHRVRREIPQSAFKRFFAFFFFNGAAGGLIWIAVIGTLTYFATIGTISFGEKQFKVSVGMSDEDFKQFLILYPTAMIYALDYALTALFIHRKFLPNRPAKITGLFAILIAGMWAVGPSIVLFFMNRLTWNSVEGLQLGNVFNAFYLHSDERLPDHLIFAGGWLILMLMLNAKWFWQRVKNFQPPIRVTPENSPPVLPQ
jgi:hypothetical protein